MKVSLATLVALLVSALAGASSGSRPEFEADLVPTANEKATGREKGEAEEIKARAEWFYRQRAYPAEHTPAGALNKAREAAKKLEKGKTSGVAGANVGVSWTPIGPHPVSSIAPGDDGRYMGPAPVSGRVTAIAPVSATTAYAGGAAGGVWKTTDGGGNWTPVFDDQPSLAVGAISVDPSSSNTVWVGTGEPNLSGDSYFGQGLFKSTDAGGTWSKIGGATFDRCHIGDVAIPAPGTILVAASAFGRYSTTCPGGVWRSTDGGATWERRVAGTVLDLTVSGTTAYAGAYGAIFRSTSSGLDWVRLDGPGNTHGLPTAGAARVAVAASPIDANRAYAIFQSSSTGAFLGLWSTNDGGANWAPSGVFPSGPSGETFCSIGGGGQCWYDLAIAASPSDATAFYAAGIILYRSTDGGATMLGPVGYRSPTSSIHVDYHALAYDPAGNLWIGTDGGVYRIAAGTTTATNLNQDLELSEFQQGLSGSMASGKSLLGGLQDNGSLQYGGSVAWPQIFGGDGGATAISADQATRFVSYVTGQIYKSTGGSFSRSTTGINQSDPVEFYAPFLMSSTNSATLYMGTNKVYQTTNGASSWAAISPQLPSASGERVTSIGLASSNPSVVFAGTSDGRIRRTDDGGTSGWSASGTGIPNRYVTDIEVSPSNPQIAYATFSGFGATTASVPGHVYKTVDGGTSWTDVSGNLPDTPTNAIVVDYRFTPATLYVGTDVGVLSSESGGTTWENVSTNGGNGSSGLPNAVVMDLIYDSASNKLVAATHGRGAYAATLPTPGGPPTITGFTPPSGPAATEVTISGTNLAGATAVAFHGTAGTIVGTPTGSKLYARVPASATSGPITVTTPDGTATSSGSFTVTTFADVPVSHPFFNYIEQMYARGITSGCGRNTLNQLLYCPLNNVTRQEMAVFIVRAKGLTLLPSATPTFADVPLTHQFYGYIERFYQQGITQGCGRNGGGQLIFCPLNNVTRQEIAAFIIRAFP